MVKKMKYYIYDNETKEFIKEEYLSEDEARYLSAIQGYFLTTEKMHKD